MDEYLMSLFPDEYAVQLQTYDAEPLEEIRMAAGQPLILRTATQERLLWPKVSQPQLEELLQRACRHSAYAHAETLRQGYLSLEGGHRVGICGTGVIQNGVVRNLTMPSSLVLRFARDVPGCADGLLSRCCGSMLLLGPPGSGKTTLLRDLVRQLSDQKRQRVGLADERGELSAAVSGVPQLQVGRRTDVLLHIPKAEAVMMLLRTMNPQWIAMDEVTAPTDLEAMVQASYCGVHLLATAHGANLTDLYSRPLYRKLMETKVFSEIVLLHQDKTYTIEEVQP